MIRDSYRRPDPVWTSVKPEPPKHAPAMNVMSAYEDRYVLKLHLGQYIPAGRWVLSIKVRHDPFKIFDIPL